MPRPRLRAGEHGDVHAKRDPDTGKWVARTRYRHPGTGKVAEITARGDRKADALARLDAKLDAVIERPRGNVTIGELADMWMGRIIAEGSRQPTTLDDYAGTLRNHIVRSLGAVPVAELTLQQAVRFITDLHDRRPGAARSARTVLSMLLRFAVAEGYAGKSVLADAGLRLPGKKWVNPTIVGEDVLEELLAAADAWRGRTPIGLYVRIALATGGRIGEIIGLRVSDYEPATDRLDAALHFNGSVIEVRKVGVYRRPTLKTNSSRRAVEIAPPIARAVEGHIRRIAAEKGSAHGDDLLFATKNGRPITPGAMRRVWRRVRGAVGGELDDLGSHGLRRTFATMTARRLGAEVAARALGHSGTAQLYSAYLRTSERVGLNLGLGVRDARSASSAPELES